jgi:CheY-like chemotaxis protein
VLAEESAIVGPTGLVFRALGYQIRVATNANYALAALASEFPDVILCDAELHGVDVPQFTRDVRSIQGGDRIIVILTAYGGEPPANAADGFISRPFDPIKVVDLIEALVRSTGS